MPVPAVQRFLYRKLRANIEAEQPRVKRALDRFGTALRKIGLPYATGLTRQKATLFAASDSQEISEAKEALRKMDRTRANLALGEYWRREHGLPKFSRKRVRLDRNILLAIAASLGLHAGASEIVCDTFKEELRTTLDPEKPVKPEETGLTGTEMLLAAFKRIDDANLILSNLMKQKAEFSSQLLQYLIQGKTISISAFAAKAVTLETNITLIKNFLAHPFDNKLPELIDEQEMRSLYETDRDQAAEWVKNIRADEEKIDGLHNFAHFAVLKAYLAGTGFKQVVTEGIYNCVGATWFLAALEDDLVHSPDYGVVFLNGHVRSWYRDSEGTLWEIENTDGGPPRRTVFTKGVRAPLNGIIAEYLLGNGTSIDELPKELADLFRQERPDSGLSVPPGLIPNPYFGKKDPSSLAQNTQELYEKMSEAGNLIEEARVIAASYSLFEGPGSGEATGPINLSIANLIRGLKSDDLCRIADKYIYTGNQYLDVDVVYSGAIALAELAAAREGASDSNPCRKKLEWSLFEQAAEREIAGEIPFSETAWDRGIAFPARAREYALKLFKKNDESSKNIALELLSRIASPDDFDLFNDLLSKFEDDQVLTHVRKAIAIHYFYKMQGDETEKAREALSAAYQKESDARTRIDIMRGLAKLGYGMEALAYMEEALSPDAREALGDLNPEEADAEEIFTGWLDSFRGEFATAITTLYPDREPSEADLWKLLHIIDKEENEFNKIDLIMLLAVNGWAVTAQQQIFSYLYAHGYRTDDMTVFFINYRSLLKYADLLIRDRAFTKSVIAALREILNQSGNSEQDRIFAAYQLIRAGKL